MKPTRRGLAVIAALLFAGGYATVTHPLVVIVLCAVVPLAALALAAVKDLLDAVPQQPAAPSFLDQSDRGYADRLAHPSHH